MATAQAGREQAEALVNTGLRNLWYPIAPSWMVGTAPSGMTRLGEDIVVWRDAAGGVHAIEDRCPHRGARLSLGWNLGDRIACWYHGVEVASDGSVARVPAQVNCPMEGKRLLKTYPCVECNDAIFAWFGDALHQEPTPLELPEQLTSDSWSAMLCTAHWKCNYRYAIENVMDPMHGAYLHSASHSMARGDKESAMQARDTNAGFVFEKIGQRGVNFDWTEFGESGLQWMRLEIPYGKEGGPGGPFWIVGAVVPVDEHNCRVFFWRCRQTSGWQKNAWRFLYRTRLEGLHWHVLEQDRVILETMSDDARRRENLYQHDAGIVRLRRILQRKAEAQLAELAAADPKAGPSSAAAE
jgi:phenylpropionate dioxygenase-like ring-hydroxylating dioxygenase large terminal subunit